MQRIPLAHWLCCGLLMLAVACSNNGDGNPDGSTPDGSVAIDGSTPDGSTTCIATNESCSAQGDRVCCSGTCDPATDRCTESGLCSPAASACSSGSDCCSNSCVNGTCSGQQCRDVGGACTGADDCCTGVCNGGTCGALTTPPGSVTCDVLGQACTTGAECCSTNCQGGVCVRAYSCQANGDVCTSNAQCCGGACSSNDGTTAGRCLVLSGGPGGGQCEQGGNPCVNPNECCSRICQDLGSGVAVCVPAAGCNLTGTACESTDLCCGGTSTGENTGVTCQFGATPGVGTCDNGQACNPTGNTCGASQPLADGGTFSIPASQNCCNGKQAVCKSDSAGIPRCFGGFGDQCPTGYTGEEPCCVPEGETCNFRDECCGGRSCLPNADGGTGLTCQGGGSCDPVGTTCNPSGTNNCCTGTACLPSSELTYACQVPRPPSDGGTPDAGADAGTVCKANGATGCTAGTECCSGICNAGTCEAPAVCQPQNGACTEGADCCAGLQCATGADGAKTCQPGATCSSAGQACSSGAGCCNGLVCLSGTGAACNGTSSCTCNVVID